MGLECGLEAEISEDKPLQHLMGFWHSFMRTIGKVGTAQAALILLKHVVHEHANYIRESDDSVFTAHGEL